MTGLSFFRVRNYILGFGKWCAEFVLTSCNHCHLPNYHPPPPDQAFLSGILDSSGRYLYILKTDDSTPESMSPRRITGFVLWASRAFLFSRVSWKVLAIMHVDWKCAKNKELQRKRQRFSFGNHHQLSGAACWGPAASLRRVGTSWNHHLQRSHFICHDTRNVPVCARLSECKRVVVCLRLSYILSKNHDSYFRFISWRWKYHLPNRVSNLYNFHSPSSFGTQIGEWACSKGIKLPCIYCSI